MRRATANSRLESAVFNITKNYNGKPVKLGSVSFTLVKGAQVKIVGKRKGSSAIGGVKTLRSEQLTGLNQLVNETLPVKIQIGATILVAFYVPCTGTAAVKTLNPRGIGMLNLSRRQTGGERSAGARHSAGSWRFLVEF
jgi:hypothetical protein